MKIKEQFTKNSHAISVLFESKNRVLCISFSDNTKISFPVDKYNEFKEISDEDLKLAKIGFAGTAICLEKHDLHVYIPGLIANIPSIPQIEI